MRWSNLYSTRTECCVNKIVSDYRDFTTKDREFNGLPDNIPVPLVFGINCNRGVAEISFGPCGCNNYKSLLKSKFIFNVIQLSLFIFMLNFQI